jgi:hypothetical protein
MLLSELQKIIQDTIMLYGDMDIVRTRTLDLDGIIQNDFEKNLIKYSSKDFDVLNGPKNYFTIKTPFYD